MSRTMRPTTSSLTWQAPAGPRATSATAPTPLSSRVIPTATFEPSGNVTGYEVLAMILRAVGYDQKNEFTGADWALHVAEIAERQGILDNVKGVDLNAPATREVVAELLFRTSHQRSHGHLHRCVRLSERQPDR